MNSALVRLAPAGLVAAPDLGFYASAVEHHPIITLTTTAGMIGALWGGLAGWSVGKLFGSSIAGLKIGSMAGGGLGAVKGFSDGRSLSRWLEENA